MLPSSSSANRENKENGGAPKSGKPQPPPPPQPPAMQQQQHATVQSVPATVIAAAPTLNANAQAALMILLTAQMQSQTGETSILQNPHVVGILQNLVNQAGDPTKQCETNVTELLNDPALSSELGRRWRHLHLLHTGSLRHKQLRRLSEDTRFSKLQNRLVQFFSATLLPDTLRSKVLPSLKTRPRRPRWWRTI